MPGFNPGGSSSGNLGDGGNDQGVGGGSGSNNTARLNAGPPNQAAAAQIAANAAAQKQAQEQATIDAAIARFTPTPDNSNLLNSIGQLFSYNPARDNTPGINPNPGYDPRNDPSLSGFFSATDPTDNPARFTPEAFGGDDGGNYQAITNFLANPTADNIPTNNINVDQGLNSLQQALAGIDNVVDERGFNGLGYAESGRNRARSIFDQFGAGQNFDDLLNYDVGTQFGNDALNETETNFRTGFNSDVDTRFGEDFQLDLIDPDAFTTTVDNILGDRRDSASRIIGNAGARGNLSVEGAATANSALGDQSEGVRERISNSARGVEGQGQLSLTGIADEARGGVSDFTLGDPSFDVTPFGERATESRTASQGSFSADVDSALGNDPLFDTGSALSGAAGSQGVVSGNAPTFLDTLAQRQGSGGSSRDRRGLGSKGSGTF